MNRIKFQKAQHFMFKGGLGVVTENNQALLLDTDKMFWSKGCIPDDAQEVNEYPNSDVKVGMRMMSKAIKSGAAL